MLMKIFSYRYIDESRVSFANNRSMSHFLIDLWRFTIEKNINHVVLKCLKLYF